jgi:KDO2-lipid IV(A) lauroyltransferase
VKRRSDLPVYLLLRAAMAVVRVLPRALAIAAAGTFGRLARAAGLRRSVTAGNLRDAFPELGDAERARIERGVYRHFGRMAADSLRLSAAGPSALAPYVNDGDLVKILEPALAAGRGAIVLTGHIGNWELAGAHLAARGFPIVAVVKEPSNRYVARHTARVRDGLGITTVPMPEARTGIPEALRQNRVVALVADQGALRSNTWSPFFGRPTKTPVGPGLFHHQTGAPVYFGAMVAEPGNRYRLVGELLVDRLEGELNDVIQRIADLYRVKLEELVRRFPEQYLWTHRLWKQQLPQAPAAP